MELRFGFGLGLGLGSYMVRVRARFGVGFWSGVGLEAAVHLAELILAAQLATVKAGVSVDAVEEDQRACRRGA